MECRRFLTNKSSPSCKAVSQVSPVFTLRRSHHTSVTHHEAISWLECHVSTYSSKAVLGRSLLSFGLVLRPFDSDDAWEYVDRMILYVMVSVCDKTNHLNSCDVIYHDPALSQQLFSRWVNTGKAWAKILRLLLRSQLTSWLAHVCSNWVTVYVSRGLTSLYIYSFLARGFVLCLGRMAQLLQELATERPEHTFWRKVLDTSVSEAERQSEPQIHDDSCIICRPNRQMVFRISTFLFEIESQGPFWRKPRDVPRKLIKSSNSSGRGHQHRSRIVLAWCPGLAAL